MKKIDFSFLRLVGLSLLVFALALNLHAQTGTLLYQDPNQPMDARVNDLLARLTLDEKISLIHADSKFSTAAVPRLGIPERWMSDGPMGVREDISHDSWNAAGHTDDYSTAMPAGICLASTWDPALAHAEGQAIGEEARARGKDIMLGPAVNIYRTPLCGRNFEYFGEDPYLAGQMAVGFIQGEQSQDVSSCVKHFALNNQEFERGSVDVEVDERALREIYLPAFRAAVQEGGVWSVMGAYNQFRGQHCCENDYLLNQILKGEWGFKGLVMSDWGGAHDTRECALNGLDLEMGSQQDYDSYYLAQPYEDALKAGSLPMDGLDDKVRRNLREMFATHVFDSDRATGSLNTVVHQTVSRHVAEEGIVLLKNNGILPLDLSRIRTIAVIGDNATRLQCHAGGSSELKALYEVSPLQGLVKRAGKDVNIIASQGYAKDGGPELAERAVAAAKMADVVIYIGGLNKEAGDTEGADRKDYKLPYGQDELIQKIEAANHKTIVVLFGTPSEMDAWVSRADAVLQVWYGGMESGNALAGILFGDINPSGKLPCTIAKRLEDSPAHAMRAYPGSDGVVTYSEGLLVGYRWFDTKKIEPQFPFGFGLSYTTFKFSDLKLIAGGANGTLVTAQFNLENTGNRPGAEVAELYVHENKPHLVRPEKELKGFKRVFLQPGEKQTVTIPLTQPAFSYYDPSQKSWVAQKDGFKILIGNSSQDIRLDADFTLPDSLTFN
jgi:beta-glucosidase